MKIICFSANVRQYSIAYGVRVLCLYKFVLNLFINYFIALLPARVAANFIKRICLCKW